MGNFQLVQFPAETSLGSAITVNTVDFALARTETTIFIGFDEVHRTYDLPT
jgi:hypothetical protein